MEQAYIGKTACGCTVAVIAISQSTAPDMAEYLAEWRDDGLTPELIAVADLPSLGCSHNSLATDTETRE